jgi:hypothetical protein
VILAGLYSEPNQGSGTVSLLNAESGERFDLFSSQRAPSLGWQPTETALALYYSYYDEMEGELVDIATGQTSRLPKAELLVPGQESADGRYRVQVTDQPGVDAVRIEDRQSGSVITVEDPFNGSYPDWTVAHWSADGLLLAVERGDWGEMGERTTGLAIHTADGQLYRSYTDTTNWSWAPDGSYRILFYPGYYFHTSDPCILDVQANSTECMGEIAAWLQEHGIANASFFQWLPDGSGMSFIYWNYETGQTGLCIMGIASRQINCPVNEHALGSAAIGVEEGGEGRVWLIRYQWSVDGRYISLVLNAFPPGAEDGNFLQLATIASDGGNFHLWGFGGWEVVWRPSLPAATTP